MKINYPLFIRAKDDKSIESFDSWERLKGWYEQIDIEEGLYEGWDVNGYPIKLKWDSKSGSQIEILEEFSRKD